MDIKIIQEYINKMKKNHITKWLMLGIAGFLLILSCNFENNNKKLENRDEKPTNISINEDEYKNNLENELEDFLCNIKGIDSAKVMITMKSTGEKKVKEDSEITDEKNNSGNANDEESILKGNSSSKEYKKYTTVILKNDSNEEPYIIEELYPKVDGIVICAKKIENNETKKELISVVESLFGIEAHKISITEMK